MLIGLNKLPENAYVQLKNMKSLVKAFFKCTSNVKAISKKIGIPRTLMFKLRSGVKEKIKLGYLRKISSYLESKDLKEFSIKGLEKNVSALSCCHGKSIKIFRLPFSFETKEALKALTFPLSDGYISRDYSGHIRIGYVNAHQNLHKEVIRCVTKTFGKVEYTTRRVAGAYDTYFTGILGKIYVECLGYAYGNKVENNPGLPKLLLELKESEKIGVVISQILDDEGYFHERTLYVGISGGKIENSKIKYIMNNFSKNEVQKRYMPNLLKGLNFLLNKIDVTASVIKPKVYFDKTAKTKKLMWYLLISGPSNILKLYKVCEIKRKDLRSKLLQYVKKWEYLLLNLEKIQNERGGFRSDNIADILDISIFSARNMLKTLLRYKIVEKSNEKYRLSKFPVRG